MLKVIGYVRVSTDDQALSLEVQEAKVRSYCSLYDLELVDLIVDDGQSARTINRPGLQLALKMMRAGFAKGLVIAKLDRLSRSVGDWSTLIRDYFGEQAGNQLFSVQDSIDTRTAAGRLVLNVLVSVAQWEREVIAERTKDALGVKRAAGELVGEVPFGSELAPDGKTLVVHQAEQLVLGRIRQWRSEGLGVKAIANRLTAEGIPTKTGKNRWVHTTVARILKRPQFV